MTVHKLRWHRCGRFHYWFSCKPCGGNHEPYWILQHEFHGRWAKVTCPDCLKRKGKKGMSAINELGKLLDDAGMQVTFTGWKAELEAAEREIATLKAELEVLKLTNAGLKGENEVMGQMRSTIYKLREVLRLAQLEIEAHTAGRVYTAERAGFLSSLKSQIKALLGGSDGDK